MGELRWRRSDWISVGTLVLVASWIWIASAKSSALDENIRQVADPVKGLDAQDRRLTSLETHVRDKDDEILRALAVINRKLDQGR